jgi:predicted PP-loop superfamily ATPase
MLAQEDESMRPIEEFCCQNNDCLCWPVKTLAVENEDGRFQQYTPAMTAKLADHVRSIKEWAMYPAANGNV